MEEKTIFQFIFQHRNTFHGDDVKDEYKCVVCNHLLCDPHSAKCGCSFCKCCMDQHFVNNNSCPGETGQCQLTNADNGEFLKNHFLRNKIKSLKIKCPCEGCIFNGTIEDTINHFQNCEKKPFSCEYSILGCSTELTNENFENHQNEKVAVHLKYVLENMIGIKNENNVLANKMEEIENTYNSLRDNFNQVLHKNNENEEKINLVENKILELENKNLDLAEITEIKDQNYENKITVLENKIKELENVLSNKFEIMEEKVINISLEKDAKINLLENKIAELENKNESLLAKATETKTILENKIKEIEKKMDNSTKNHQNEFKLVKDEVEHLKKENYELKIAIKSDNDKINKKLQSNNKELILQKNQLKSALDEMKNQIAKEIMSTVGVIQGQPENDEVVTKILNEITFPRNSASFIWKVENLLEKREEAKRGINKVIASNKVYIFRNGYKMKIKIHPNGEGSGENTHFSVYFVICVGDFDHELEWPLKRNVTLSIVDQNNMKESYIQNFNYETEAQENKYVFDKPLNKDNNGLGIPQFISWEKLQSADSPMKDGTIIIKLTLQN